MTFNLNVSKNIPGCCLAGLDPKTEPRITDNMIIVANMPIETINFF